MPSFDDFLAELAEIFTESVSSATKYTELSDWSSLSSLSMVVMASEEFGVQLAPADLIRAETPQNLYSLIKERAES